MHPKKRASHEVNKFRERARMVIDHHFGSAKRITYLSGGLSNFVFSFTTNDGDFVIRLSPDPARIALFIKEQWAATAARKAGVPAPEILEVGSGLVEFPYMVSRTVEGREATNHPRRLEILREMGRLAAKINAIKTNGFGQTFDWSDNRLSLNRTFRSWLENEYDFRSKLETLEKHKMISRSTSRALKSIFKNAGDAPSQPRLSHGDLRLKNVIADDEGKINAIIDWEGCLSCAGSAWELSIALHDLGIDEMQVFVDGYGLSDKKLGSLMPLIKAFNITNYAPAVGEIAKRKDKRLLAQYRLRLGGLFDLYSI